MTTQEDHKKVVEEYFQLIEEGKPKESLHLFAPNCKQHNPYLKGGMDALLQAIVDMQGEEPESEDPYFEVKNILADGDMVAAHTVLINSKSNPSKGGLRQIHLFRFGQDNKIVEYWDVTQMILSEMPAAANAF